ncbi:hypothetical protein J0X19_02645 [Hymenobacter sp. BT186]|uniref:Uncharacterized protein n=1 Tax=Hymenobacter telluris TaxID=2816474 RepID=A0A939JC10_9BACT|nr:hypothetical protein [Hymenobacter telluris]MBO0356832.1 hypothetical protein [Hymenobacter telluris]MBW3372858.1 hypothetical protein [Hymenobacter norwichensis]
MTENLYRDSVRLKDLQLMSGTLVAQSKLPGVSAAITDKSFTLNMGTNLFRLRSVRRFSVQAVLTGQSEEGFTNIFDDDRYQRTVGAGLAFNVFRFGPNTTTTYYWPDSTNRAKLHRQLRQELARYDAARGQSATHNTMLQAGDTLCRLNEQGVLERAIVITRDYDALLEPADDPLSPAGLRRMALRQTYWKAIDALRPLLPKKWAGMSSSEAVAWIRSHVCVPDTLTQLAYDWHDKRTADRLDSIQLKDVEWKQRALVWTSGKILFNNEKQPIYQASETSLMKEKRFPFVDMRLGLNKGWIRRKTRYFGAVGIGYNNQRTFNPKRQVTYQRVLPQQLDPSTPPVNTVAESKFYPTEPAELHRAVGDAQYSFFWNRWRLGFDATYRIRQDVRFDARTDHRATFGLFVPALVGESAINFMLQGKWDNDEKWRLGFNVSASLPGFLTKK